jgi:hypothetical protein
LRRKDSAATARKLGGILQGCAQAPAPPKARAAMTISCIWNFPCPTCIVSAVNFDGKSIRAVEGHAKDGELSPLLKTGAACPVP